MSQKQDKLGAITTAGNIIEPLDDHVLIERGEELEKTEGGIIIPQGARAQMNHQVGFVKAVGPGQYNPAVDKHVDTGLEVGDRVIFTKYAGTEADVQGTELLLMRRAEIIAKIVDDPNAEAAKKPSMKSKAKKKTRKAG